jgi:hypothetical protein
VDPEVRSEIPDLTKKVIAGAGSIAKAVEALSQDDSDDARAFIAAWNSVSKSDRQRLVLEDFVAVSGLSARRFIEVLTGALMQQCQDVTKMMVAVATPKVMAATIKAATDQVPITAWSVLLGANVVVGHTNGDTKAMEMWHKGTGFLPTPKGATTTISLQQLNQTATADDDSDDFELENMDDYLLELQGVVNPQLAAPISSISEIPATMPYIEELEIEV